MPVQFTAAGRTYSAGAFLLDKDGTLISFDHWLKVMQVRADRLASLLGLSSRERDSLLRHMGVDPETGQALPRGIIHLPRCDAEAAVAAYLARLGLAQPLPVVSRVFQEVDREFPFERYLEPVPGVEEVLVAIRRAGGRVAIVTSDAAAATEKHLRALGWDQLVDVIVGTDVCPVKKPAPDPVLFACRRLSVYPGAAVMAGDSPADLVAGRSAGCRLSIGVLTGLGQPDDLSPHADLLLPALSSLEIAP